MPMLNLLRRLSVRHAFFLLLIFLLFGGFEFLICMAVSTMNISGILAELMQSLPPFMQSFIGSQFSAGLTTRSLLAFGWNHPLAHALGTAIAIVLAARAVAGEIESGAIELILSQPISRLQFLAGQILFAMSALASLSLAGMAGTMLGQRAFALEGFAFELLFKLAGNFFLLQTAWYALTLAFSVFGRENGRVAAAAFLLALISYLLNALGSLWPDAAFLLPYSLHNYYSPQTLLIENTLPIKSLVVLFSLMAAGLGLATWHFQRRDIP